MDYNKIMQAFGVQDEILICEPFGSGHINDTYLCDNAPRYILQRINHNVFASPENLMENVSSSGFDFNEALHPTMELEEILKALQQKPSDRSLSLCIWLVLKSPAEAAAWGTSLTI